MVKEEDSLQEFIIFWREKHKVHGIEQKIQLKFQFILGVNLPIYGA